MKLFYYFQLTTVNGIISQIRASSLKGKTHIEVDGINYKIYCSKDQNKSLRKCYRESNLEFKIKQKVSVRTGKISSAELLSFKEKNKGTLFENVSKLDPQSDLSIVDQINTIDDIIRLIRD